MKKKIQLSCGPLSKVSANLPGIEASSLPSPRQGRKSDFGIDRGRISDFGLSARSDFRLRYFARKTHHRASAEGPSARLSSRVPLAECFLPLTRPAVNPGVGTGLLLSILLWQQDCFNHSCAGNRIALVHYEQLGLGTVLARAQACDGVGPAVELPGECVSQLRVKDQVVAPSRTIVVHAAAGENVRRVSVDALVRQAGQSA